jgi:membrane protease YdiL (CAAX protease family)
MTESGSEKPALPFNNLFLNAGAITGFNRPWMYLFGLCGAMFGYFTYQIILQVPLIAIAFNKGITLEDIVANPNLIFDPDKLGINKNLLLVLLFGMFIFALLGLYIVIKRVHKKPFLSIVTAYEKVRWNRIFFAFTVWGALTVISVLASKLMYPDSMTFQFDPLNFILLLIVSIVLMPIQTSTEEFIFRGYLVQGLSQIFKNGIVPVIITSLFFGIVHLSNPEARTHGWMIMLPYYSSFGLFLGLLTLLDEGLELALGIHCANNLLSSLLVTTPDGVLKTDALFVAKSENPSGEIILWLFLAAVTFIIFWLRYRWKNFNLMVK